MRSEETCDGELVSSGTGPTLAGDRVSGCQLVVVVLIEGIDISRGELARWHPLGKQDVEFVEGTALGLWKAEIGPDEDTPGAKSPDETCVPLQIPCLWVHEVILKGAADDTGNVGSVTGEADSLLTKAGGANFSGQSPA